MKVLALQLLVVFSMSVPVWADKVREFEEIHYVRDGAKKLTVTDLLGKPSLFTKAHGKSYSFGHTEEAIWVYVDYEAQNDDTQYLSFRHYLVDEVLIWFINDKNEIIESHIGGSAHPKRDRYVESRNFNYLVPQGTAKIFFKITSTSTMNFEVSLNDELGFLKYEIEGTIGIAIILGFLILMLIHTLVLFVSTRRFAFLFYALYIVSVLIFLLVYSGLAFSLSLPIIQNTYVWISASEMLVIICFSMLAYHFNELRLVKNAKHVIYGIIAISALLCALSYSEIRLFINSVLDFWYMVSGIIIMVLVSRRIKAGNYLSRYFFAGWAGLFVVSIIATLASFGDQFNFGMTIFILFLGVVLEILVYSTGFTVVVIADLRKLNLLQRQVSGKSLNEEIANTKSLYSEQVTKVLDTLKDLRAPEVIAAREVLSKTFELGGSPYEARLEPREKVDLRELMKNLVNIMHQDLAHATKNFYIEYGHDPLIANLAPTKFYVALKNIILNAIEALNDVHQPITIVLTLIKEPKRLATIAVVDGGRGIEPSLLSRLSVEAVSTKEGRLGLGLLASRRIIEDFGGSLGFETDRGIGTKVIVSIPLEHT